MDNKDEKDCTTTEEELPPAGPRIFESRNLIKGGQLHQCTAVNM
jgi:hypothetical protein